MMIIPTKRVNPLKSQTPDQTKNSFSLNLSPDMELARMKNPKAFASIRSMRSPQDGQSHILDHKTRGLQSKYQFKLKILTKGQKPSPEKTKLQKSMDGERTYSEEDCNERFVRYIAGYPKISKQKSLPRPAIGYLVDHPNICEFNSVVNTLRAKKDGNLFYSFAKDSTRKPLKIDGHAKVNPNLLKFNQNSFSRDIRDLSESNMYTTRTNLQTDRKLDTMRSTDSVKPYVVFDKKDRARSENMLIPPLKIDSTRIDLKISIGPKPDGSSSSRDTQRLRPIRPSRTRALRKPESVKLSVMFDKQQ